ADKCIAAGRRIDGRKDAADWLRRVARADQHLRPRANRLALGRRLVGRFVEPTEVVDVVVPESAVLDGQHVGERLLFELRKDLDKAAGPDLLDARQTRRADRDAESLAGAVTAEPAGGEVSLDGFVADAGQTELD